MPPDHYQQKVDAIKQLLSLFRLERTVYLAITVSSLVVLLLCAAVLMIRTSIWNARTRGLVWLFGRDHLTQPAACSKYVERGYQSLAADNRRREMRKPMSPIPPDTLQRSSRQAAITTAIGACIIGGTLALSAWRLHVTESEIVSRRTEIHTLTEASVNLSKRYEMLQKSQEEILSGLQCQFGGDYEEAIKHFDRVLSLCPNDVVALTYKAGSLLKLDKAIEAEGLVRHATELNSAFTPAYFTLAVVLHHTGRTSEAIRTVKRLLSQDLSNYYAIMCSQNFEDLKDVPEFQKLMAKHLDRIKGIQRDLIKLGYYHGGVDGLIGPKTSAAIQNFCSDHSLARQGLTTEALVKAVTVTCRKSEGDFQGLPSN